MVAWLEQAAPQVIANFSLWGLLVLFIAGIATSFTPCTLSMVPIIVGYVGGTETSRHRAFMYSLLFALGTALTFTLLGFFIAAFGGIFGSRQSVIYYVVAGVCLIVGFNLLGVVKLNFRFGSTLLNKNQQARGLSGSFILGLMVGLVGSQCGTPILMVILSLALLKGQWLYGGVLLFIYALGRAVPVVACGTFSGLITRMQVFSAWNHIIEKVAGILIIIMAGYFLWLA